MSKIRVKKDMQVIFNDDFVCIDGAVMIRKEFVTLDNIELQVKIANNEPFYYANGDYQKEFPKLKELIPDRKDYKKLKDTELIQETNTQKRKLFACDGVGILGFDKQYFDYLPTNCEIMGVRKLASCIITKGDEIIGLIMPVSNYYNEIIDTLDDIIKGVVK